MLARLSTLILLSQCVSSYKYFQTKIPNGAYVPFPCKPGSIWEGVGHILNGGTGTKNPFGIDFAAANFEWTPELCRKDSDGDGLTNGEELGDPDCVWKQNAIPKRSDGIMHPGICDPWDSPVCMRKPLTGTKYGTQQEWLASMCKSDGLSCPAMNETGILQLELRIDVGAKVPPQETTYTCQMFDIYELGIPRGQSFHVVAVTPLIDNRNVLHHMVLSACKADTVLTRGPRQCGMLAAPSCMEFLHVWTVGLDGECYHPQSGMRIGEGGYTIIALQLHWNNPELRSDLTDTSGLRIFYTPNLRPFDAGVLTVGTMNFYLPPKRESLTIQGSCSSTCTKKMITDSISVTTAWNHMHYAGNRMSIIVLRNNTKVATLTDERVYSYDSPKVESYSVPFKLLPGDEIITTCGYTTKNRNKTTFFGEATADEMCFGFLTYIPKSNMAASFCVDEVGVSECDYATHEGCTYPYMFAANIAMTSSEVYRELSQNCKKFSPCLDECLESIVKFMKTEKCMQGNVWRLIQTMLAQGNNNTMDFLSYLSSCKVEVYLALNSSTSSTSTQTLRSTTDTTRSTTDTTRSTTDTTRSTNDDKVTQKQSIEVRCTNSAVSAKLVVFLFVLEFISLVSVLAWN